MACFTAMALSEAGCDNGNHERWVGAGLVAEGWTMSRFFSFRSGGRVREEPNSDVWCC